MKHHYEQSRRVREWALAWARKEYERTKTPSEWRWFTYAQCAAGTNYGANSIPSISSRLRELRLPKFTSFHLLKVCWKKGGPYQYFLVPHELEVEAANLIANYDVPVRPTKPEIEVRYNRYKRVYEVWIVNKHQSFRMDYEGSIEECKRYRQMLWKAGVGCETS